MKHRIQFFNAMRFTVAVLVLCGVLCVATCLDVPPPHARSGTAWSLMGLRSTVAPSPKYFEQKCDHFSNSTCSFSQKYYVDDSALKNSTECGGAVAFVYISGEAPMATFPGGYIEDIAKEFQALHIAVEHRFYGSSIPMNDLNVSSLHLLNTEQALADLAAVVRSIDSQYGGSSASPCFKWVSVGGSYAGAMSAWFRVRYPSLIYAAWSSSGVVDAILNFVEFDEQVRLSAGPQCGENIRASLYETEMAYFKNAAWTKALYNAPALDIPGDFLYMIADSASMAVQYGHKSDLCAALNVSDGERVSALADFTKSLWGEQFGSGCFYDTNCLKTDRSASRSWRWQKCAQLAYIQNAPAFEPLRSRLVDMKYNIGQCIDIFGLVFPETRQTNEIYGGANPKGTRIVFVNASDDPWQRASVAKHISRENENLYVECDDCGHCIDLHTPTASDPQSLVAARKGVLAALKKWLL